jgi:hypothetical protein
MNVPIVKEWGSWAVLMRKEKLKTTGDIELIKAVIFIVLIGLFWE